MPLFVVKNLDKFKSEIQYFLSNDFSHLNKTERQEKVAEITNKAALATVSTPAQPIAFADICLITPVHILMTRAIGKLYGYNIPEQIAQEVLRLISGQWLGKQACLALFKMKMPSFGDGDGAAFAFFWTYVIGKAAEVYFAGGMTISQENLKQVYNKGIEETQNAYKKNYFK